MVSYNGLHNFDLLFVGNVISERIAPALIA